MRSGALLLRRKWERMADCFPLSASFLIIFFVRVNAMLCQLGAITLLMEPISHKKKNMSIFRFID